MAGVDEHGFSGAGPAESRPPASPAGLERCAPEGRSPAPPRGAGHAPLLRRARCQGRDGRKGAGGEPRSPSRKLAGPVMPPRAAVAGRTVAVHSGLLYDLT